MTFFYLLFSDLITDTGRKVFISSIDKIDLFQPFLMPLQVCVNKRAERQLSNLRIIILWAHFLNSVAKCKGSDVVCERSDHSPCTFERCKDCVVVLPDFMF